MEAPDASIAGKKEPAVATMVVVVKAPSLAVEERVAMVEVEVLQPETTIRTLVGAVGIGVAEVTPV